MADLFIRCLNLSISAGLAILAVVLIRAVFRRIPRSVILLLWALCAMRLIIPLPIESPFSLIPAGRIEQADMAGGMNDVGTLEDAEFDGDSPYTAVGNMGSAAIVPADNVNENEQPDIVESDDIRHLTTIEKLTVLWLCGIAVMQLYILSGYLVTRIRVRKAVLLEENIYLCDRIRAPFVIGVIHPHIIIPADLQGEELSYVLTHERTHLKQGDHIWKLLSFIILSIHWFNPMVWLGFMLFSQDLEFRCDETVIKQLGRSSKKPYAKALINLSTGSKAGTFPLLGFAEAKVKRRVMNIMRYRKPRLWVKILSVLLIVVFTASCMTNPQTDNEEMPPNDNLVAMSTDEVESTESLETTTSADEHAAIETDLGSVEEGSLGELTAGDEMPNSDIGPDIVGTDVTPTEPGSTVKSKEGEDSDIITQRSETDTGFSGMEQTSVAPKTGETDSEVDLGNKSGEQEITSKEIERVFFDSPENYDEFILGEGSDIFWEDERFVYTTAFSSAWSPEFPDRKRYIDYFFIEYSDGSIEPVMKALDSGKLTGVEAVGYCEDGQLKKAAR